MAKLRFIDGPRKGGDYHTPGGYREIGYSGEILVPFIPEKGGATGVAVYRRTDNPPAKRGEKKKEYDGTLTLVRILK